MVLSLNAFAAVGDSVANVFLKKNAVDATAKYYGLKNHQTYTEWAETMGYSGINKPECAVDGRYDDWSDFSRWVAKPGPGVLEIDLDGYFSLETLDIYHVYSNSYAPTSDSDETTIQVSVDGGKKWKTIINKKPLDYDKYIVVLDESSKMGVVKSTFDMNGAVANKVRFIFEDNSAADLGIAIQEVQCSGKVGCKAGSRSRYLRRVLCGICSCSACCLRSCCHEEKKIIRLQTGFKLSSIPDDSI